MSYDHSPTLSRQPDSPTPFWPSSGRNDPLPRPQDKDLIRAAETGDTRQIRRLLTGPDKANIHARDAQGWTALHRAVKKGHVKAVAELVTGGANIHAETRNGWTPLALAVKSGHPLMISLVAALSGKTG